MNTIKIGIIGYNEGNGHPYSWSAIFNGFNKYEIGKCDYPIIIEYLNREYKHNEKLAGATVTNIWCEDMQDSINIAKACYIKQINESVEELIEETDVIIVARDDYENIEEIIKKVIESGKPVLIDKPMAITVDNAKRIFDMQLFKEQIFTCSGTRYSKTLNPSKVEICKLGKIKKIEALFPNSWEKYSIHVITPIVGIIGTIKNIKLVNKEINKDIYTVKYKINGIDVEISCTGSNNMGIKVILFGTNECITKKFDDSFFCFTILLEKFIEGVKNKKIMISKEETLTITRLIEKGLSRNQDLQTNVEGN